MKPIFTTLHNFQTKTITNRLHNITMFSSIMSLFKPLACQTTWHLTFLGRHWESKELSLDETTQTGNGCSRFCCLLIPVRGQWQQLMPGARTLELNDLSIIELPKNC